MLRGPPASGARGLQSWGERGGCLTSPVSLPKGKKGKTPVAGKKGRASTEPEPEPDKPAAPEPSEKESGTR